MCFSANASFTAGIVLSAIGVASLKKVQAPSQIAFASIPLIFAVQQISEGLIWLSLPNPEYRSMQIVATYMFLFFAQIVWPLWVPVSILLLEKDDKRATYQKVLVGLGLLLSAYLGYCLVAYHVEAKIIGYHITYKQDYPMTLKIYGGILYALATIVPLFISRIKKMWLLGVTITISYLIAMLFYQHYVLSVWCFFASIISISVYVIMLEINKSFKKKFKEGNQSHLKVSLD